MKWCLFLLFGLVGRTFYLCSMSSSSFGGLPPFAMRYSRNMPALLRSLGCSLAISTYQAGKLIFISPADGDSLIQLPRTFKKPMGVALQGRLMGLATLDEVLVLSNDVSLAATYPTKPDTYDALFIPRASYYTGALDIHDLDWGKDGQLYAVNTSFSCLIRIGHHYSFTPVWQPPFISKLASEDRCHLNGMAVEAGEPRFVTAFNAGDTPQSWRADLPDSGVLLDVDSGEFVARGLPMPHSPRLWDGRLYLLLSATGELVEVDRQTGKWESVLRLDGFVRGLARFGDYAFVGLSRFRKTSKTFEKIEAARKASISGIAVVHLPSGKLTGMIRYENSVEEIYDVQVLPGMLRPNVLNTDKAEFRLGLTTPQSTYWGRRKEEAS